VVARGGVQLAASGSFSVTPATGSALTGQMTGQGTTGLQAALGGLGAVLDRVIGPETLVGARLSWLGLLDERLADESVGLAGDLSRIEDLDIAKAATDLQLLQTFYQGALASGAQMIQLSLLNFLK